MNLNDKICTALTGLKLPVFCEFYDRKRDNSAVPYIANAGSGYLVYNYSFQRGALYGDDAEIETVTGIQVHYYTKDRKASCDAVTAALSAAGFTVGQRRRIYENDTGYVHFVVEAEI